MRKSLMVLSRQTKRRLQPVGRGEQREVSLLTSQEGKRRSDLRLPRADNSNIFLIKLFISYIHFSCSSLKLFSDIIIIKKVLGFFVGLESLLSKIIIFITALERESGL